MLDLPRISVVVLIEARERKSEKQRTFIEGDWCSIGAAMHARICTHVWMCAEFPTSLLRVLPISLYCFRPVDPPFSPHVVYGSFDRGTD